MIRHAGPRCMRFTLAAALLLCAWRVPAGAASYETACRPKPHTLSGPSLAALVLRAPVRLATPADRMVRAECIGLRYARIAIAGEGAHGFADSALIERGHLRDGRPVTIVPIISGGSGGAFEALLFTGRPGAERYVTTLRGLAPGHLRTSVERGDIVERSPQDQGSNCCWEHDYVRRSTIVRGRVRVIDVRIRPKQASGSA